MRMNKTGATTLIIIIVVVATLHAFRATEEANIKGWVVQSGGSATVLATNGIDSVTTGTVNGFFSLLVKPGNWKIHVNGRHSKRHYFVNVPVYEGKIIDLGQIRLR